MEQWTNERQGKNETMRKRTKSWYVTPAAITTPLSCPSTPGHVFGVDITHNIGNNTPQGQESAIPAKAPKTSSVSHNALEKARANIMKVSQKRTLLDTLVEIQEYVLSLYIMLYRR